MSSVQDNRNLTPYSLWVYHLKEVYALARKNKAITPITKTNARNNNIGVLLEMSSHEVYSQEKT